MIDRNLSLLLERMIEDRASDLFLSPGAPPSIKIQGVTRHLGEAALSAEEVRAMAESAMDERQRRLFETTLEMNLALQLNDAGRFRINVYRQRGALAMAVRFITASIPSLEDLHLPPVLKDLVMLPRGLVLLVGAAGSGKSTALASMIDYRNARSTGHILTVEDPVEYVHRHQQSVVDQREVGLDTQSFESALKNAMREAPDVILIGEIRDRETMQAALTYAETGHLCLSTLHANNASQALDRIINFYPDSARHQVLLDLSQFLRAVVSLRLVPGLQHQLLPAAELLLQTPYISELFQKGDVDRLKHAMQHGNDEGMCTFDQSLYKLLVEGKISREQALQNADSRNDLALQIRLHSPVGEGDAGMALEPAEDDKAERGDHALR